MASLMTICEVCRAEEQRPCVQRRDGTWACGPCLKLEWEATKRAIVGRAAGLTLGRKLYRKKSATA